MKFKSNEKTHLKDELTQKIGVLMRRETEVRILIPFLQDLYKEFSKEKILNVLEKTIKEIAKTQGEEFSKEYGNNVDAFLDTLKFWTKDDALEIDVLEKSDSKLSFNVTRCKYAEMYSALGISDLGAVLSCNRDAALIEGFNPKASLYRKETIMSGDKCCTFRYTFEN
jgi:RNAse (barnase) inhibitor barstar